MDQWHLLATLHNVVSIPSAAVEQQPHRRNAVPCARLATPKGTAAAASSSSSRAASTAPTPEGVPARREDCYFEVRVIPVVVEGAIPGPAQHQHQQGSKLAPLVARFDPSQATLMPELTATPANGTSRKATTTTTTTRGLCPPGRGRGRVASRGMPPLPTRSEAARDLRMYEVCLHPSAAPSSPAGDGLGVLSAREAAAPSAAQRWSTTDSLLRLRVEVWEYPYPAVSGGRLLATGDATAAGASPTERLQQQFHAAQALVPVSEVVERHKVLTRILHTPVGQVGVSVEVTMGEAEERTEAATARRGRDGHQEPRQAVADPRPHTYRGRLTRFLALHHPQALEGRLVDDVLAAGVPERTTFSRLYREFGICDYRRRVLKFLSTYAARGGGFLNLSLTATHGGAVASLLTAWEDQEEDLLRQLVLHNGPEVQRIYPQALRWRAFLRAHGLSMERNGTELRRLLYFHRAPQSLEMEVEDRAAAGPSPAGVAIMAPPWPPGSSRSSSVGSTASGSSSGYPAAEVEAGASIETDDLFEALITIYGPEPDPRSYLYPPTAYPPPPPTPASTGGARHGVGAAAGAPSTASRRSSVISSALRAGARGGGGGGGSRPPGWSLAVAEELAAREVQATARALLQAAQQQNQQGQREHETSGTPLQQDSQEAARHDTAGLEAATHHHHTPPPPPLEAEAGAEAEAEAGEEAEAGAGRGTLCRTPEKRAAPAAASSRSSSSGMPTSSSSDAICRLHPSRAVGDTASGTSSAGRRDDGTSGTTADSSVSAYVVWSTSGGAGRMPMSIPARTPTPAASAATPLSPTSAGTRRSGSSRSTRMTQSTTKAGQRRCQEAGADTFSTSPTPAAPAAPTGDSDLRPSPSPTSPWPATALEEEWGRTDGGPPSASTTWSRTSSASCTHQHPLLPQPAPRGPHREAAVALYGGGGGRSRMIPDGETDSPLRQAVGPTPAPAPAPSAAGVEEYFEDVCFGSTAPLPVVPQPHDSHSPAAPAQRDVAAAAEDDDDDDDEGVRRYPPQPYSVYDGPAPAPSTGRCSSSSAAAPAAAAVPSEETGIVARCAAHPSRPVEFFLPAHRQFVCSLCAAEDTAAAIASPSRPAGALTTAAVRLEAAAWEAERILVGLGRTLSSEQRRLQQGVAEMEAARRREKDHARRQADAEAAALRAKTEAQIQQRYAALAEEERVKDDALQRSAERCQLLEQLDAVAALAQKFEGWTAAPLPRGAVERPPVGSRESLERVAAAQRVWEVAVATLPAELLPAVSTPSICSATPPTAEQPAKKTNTKENGTRLTSPPPSSSSSSSSSSSNSVEGGRCCGSTAAPSPPPTPPLDHRTAEQQQQQRRRLDAFVLQELTALQQQQRRDHRPSSPPLQHAREADDAGVKPRTSPAPSRGEEGERGAMGFAPPSLPPAIALLRAVRSGTASTHSGGHAEPVLQPPTSGLQWARHKFGQEGGRSPSPHAPASSSPALSASPSPYHALHSRGLSSGERSATGGAAEDGWPRPGVLQRTRPAIPSSWSATTR